MTIRGKAIAGDQRDMIVAALKNTTDTIEQIAEQFVIAVGTVRKLANASKVSLKGRGEPVPRLILGTRERTFAELPAYEAGCKMPSPQSIINEGVTVALYAELSSDALLKRQLETGQFWDLSDVLPTLAIAA